MAVRLRLRRTGTKNKACFRIVAADARSPRDGRFIEVLGFYDPRHDDEKIDIDRAAYWVRSGAQPSRTVAAIMKRAETGTARTGRKIDAAVPAAAPDKPADAEVASVDAEVASGEAVADAAVATADADGAGDENDEKSV